MKPIFRVATLRPRQIPYVFPVLLSFSLNSQIFPELVVNPFFNILKQIPCVFPVWKKGLSNSLCRGNPDISWKTSQTRKENRSVHCGQGLRGLSKPPRSTTHNYRLHTKVCVCQRGWGFTPFSLVPCPFLGDSCHPSYPGEGGSPSQDRG